MGLQLAVQMKLQRIHSMYNANWNEWEDVWNLLLMTVFAWRKWAVFCKGHWARRNSLVMKGYGSSSERRKVKLFPSYCSANFLVMQETMFVETKQFVCRCTVQFITTFLPLWAGAVKAFMSVLGKKNLHVTPLGVQSPDWIASSKSSLTNAPQTKPQELQLWSCN